MEPIEHFLPAFHFRERHERRIAAPPARVAAELRDVDLARSPLIGPLFALRGLPARLSRAFARKVTAGARAPADTGAVGGEGGARSTGAVGAGPADDAAARAAAALEPGRLGRFFDTGFVTLHDEPGRALVVGSVGAFWRNDGGVVRIAPQQFVTDRSPGCVRLAWMFDFQPLDSGRACRAVTETRIHSNDAAARRAMTLYWLAIRPASGLIRREMLRLLAARCSDPASPR